MDTRTGYTMYTKYVYWIEIHPPCTVVCDQMFTFMHLFVSSAPVQGLNSTLVTFEVRFRRIGNIYIIPSDIRRISSRHEPIGAIER